VSGRYVYAIGIEGSTLVKIGMSRNPVSRLKTLEQSMPYTLVLLHQIWREDARRIERNLHRILQERQQRGEWFDLPEPDLEELFAEALTYVEQRPMPSKPPLLDMHPLSGRLRQIRKQAGLTQRQLEEQSGVPQNTISRIEIGSVQDVSAKTLANLARALKVSMDHRIGLDSEPEPQVKRKSSKTRARTSAKAAKG